MKNTSNIIKKRIAWLAKILSAAVETIFPKVSTMRDGGLFGRSLNLCNGYNNQQDGYTPKTHARSTYFLKYKDPEVKKRIWQFKYYLNQVALAECTYILYDELIAEVSDRVSQIPFCDPYPLIHCPSSTYFKGNKKFDHMKELVCKFDELQNPESHFFISCTHAILPRANQATNSGDIRLAGHVGAETNMRAQHTGTRKERLEWADQRFFISEKFEDYLRGKLGESALSENSTDARPTIYCIDDVITTGASLASVSKLLEKKFNVQVKTFCICH